MYRREKLDFEDYISANTPSYSLAVSYFHSKVVESYFAMLRAYDAALDMCRNEDFKPLRPPEYNGASL